MSGAHGYGLVLVVEPGARALSDLLRVLRGVGYHAVGATSFEEARRQIKLDPPRVLIAPARLGAFSGMHLAVLARSARADAQALIVSGAYDASFEREVADLGAVFAAAPIASELLPAMLRTIFGVTPAAANAPVAYTPFLERRIADRRQHFITDIAVERRVTDRRRSPRPKTGRPPDGE